MTVVAFSKLANDDGEMGLGNIKASIQGSPNGEDRRKILQPPRTVAASAMKPAYLHRELNGIALSFQKILGLGALAGEFPFICQ